jgi:5-methyltetrahydropteroyltriglutamate--homocysteine methyltransferase
MLDHFVLKAHTRVTPKMTYRVRPFCTFAQERHRDQEYANRDAIFDDLAKTHKQAIPLSMTPAAVTSIRRHRLGLSRPSGTGKSARARTERGASRPRLRRHHQQSVGASPPIWWSPPICRGNFRSTWISEGGYEPVAEVLLGQLNYDGYFLEYDTERAGGFEPLRFLPKGNKIVVLGLITTKSGQLEKKDDVKRRIEEATKYAALDQLSLSPQCGFASTEEGNVLAEEEQWAKLRMAVELADAVWG